MSVKLLNPTTEFDASFSGLKNKLRNHIGLNNKKNNLLISNVMYYMVKKYNKKGR